MLTFSSNLYTDNANLADELEESGIKETGGAIKTSDEISGIEIRLSHVVVKDNKTPKVGPFPGFAKVYFVNIVVSDLGTDSVTLKLQGFEKVNDGDALSLDKTLFFWKKTDATPVAPSQVHVMSSLIKSKQSLRDVGEILAKINADQGFKDLKSTLATILKDASRFNEISDVVLQVAGIVGNFLGKVEDKPLLTWFQSFTDIAGDWDPKGLTERKAENKFASMQLNLFVRDADRQKMVEEANTAIAMKAN